MFVSYGRSLDGGESLPLEELIFDSTLVDPAVAAGALQKEGVLYFTNPASSQQSKDQGGGGAGVRESSGRALTAD